MTPPASKPARRVTATAELAFLKRAQSYPDRPSTVQCVETHYAWVFLARRFAYKLKKPVRTAWFDYTTSTARYTDACNEVILNRRLAPDVYLGVVPLTVENGAELRLEGSGQPIDWLVKMRLLEPQRMLDYALREGQVSTEQIDAVADLLTQFWVQQPSENTVVDLYSAQLVEAITDNVNFLLHSEPFVQVNLKHVARQLKNYLFAHRTLFEQRLANGRVKELHGDLRPEHVCLTTPPVVIDCLQFSRALRVLDVADELAFLSLECEKLGGGWLESSILQRYTEVSNDRPPDCLIAFYKGCRALLRARLAAGHLADCPAASRGHWLSTTNYYLGYARTHAATALRSATANG